MIKLKFLPRTVNASPAQLTKSQRALLLQRDNVEENAQKSPAQRTQSFFRTVPANHATPGLDHKKETESVAQMSVDKEKDYREMVAAQHAETTLEEMERPHNNKDYTLNASQINALPIKFWPKKVHANTAAHTRKPMLTREAASNQLAEKTRDSSKMLLSTLAQNTAEQPPTADLAHQTNAHWEKNCWKTVNALRAQTTREPPKMEEAAEEPCARRTKSCSLTEDAKTAHHSRRLLQVVSSVSKLIAHRLRDFSQAVNASHVKHTQEPSMMERPAHQTSVPPEKRSSVTELARPAHHSPGPSLTEENAPPKCVPPVRSSKSMVDAPIATHTPEPQLTESNVSHTTAKTDRSSDQKEAVLTAPTTRELKELVSPADPILVTSDRECWRMVLASIAHSTNQSVWTEDAAASQLADQVLNTSPRMVSASHAALIKPLDQMVLHARPTHWRSSQILKSLHQLQSALPPARSQHAAPPQAATFGPTSNSYPRTRLPDSTWTRRLETWASFWVMPRSSQQQLHPFSLPYSLHWMLSEERTVSDEIKHTKELEFQVYSSFINLIENRKHLTN